eukprot:CAMPEP_0170496654 /NCGR_PEP_ID=MMETSP0208-20121228/22286_1 /TAXON_ID=197538 /ORGANISM="Strombidium inclinatum, Strain S3" /LENGTH=57 /DNA_ID=CAMNT_0010773255 /DNA_START=309 /DNA_END=482 /DNA_ORIENTATION=+
MNVTMGTPLNLENSIKVTAPARKSKLLLVENKFADKGDLKEAGMFSPRERNKNPLEV